MKLMTKEEIAELQKEFDSEVDKGVDYWAYICYREIEMQIKAKNTGASKNLEGKIQIEPCRFYISPEINEKIVASNLNFHNNSLYLSNAIDTIRKNVREGWEYRNLYVPFSLSGFDQIYRIENPALGGGQYEIYFVPSIEVHTEKTVTGFIFKREKEVKKNYVTFKGLSLELLKKLHKKCKDNGVELTGIEILYWSPRDGEYYLEKKIIIDDIFGSVEGYIPWGNCILLRWNYQM